MKSLSGSLLSRWGAWTYETKVLPVASISSRLHGSPRKRTVCPRSTRRRATARAGGRLPPPSQLTKRNRLGIMNILPPFFSSYLAGSHLTAVCIQQPVPDRDAEGARCHLAHLL